MTPEKFAQIMKSVALSFPQRGPDFSDEALAKNWFFFLKHLTEPQLRAALLHCVRTEKFFPSISTILQASGTATPSIEEEADLLTGRALLAISEGKKTDLPHAAWAAVGGGFGWQQIQDGEKRPPNEAYLRKMILAQLKEDKREEAQALTALPPAPNERKQLLPEGS